MAEGKLLYCINHTELEHSHVYLEQPTVLKFVQTDGNEMKTGKSLEYFKAPELAAYPLLLNIGHYNEKSVESKLKCTEMMERFVIEKGFYNTTSTDRYKVITRRHVLGTILTAPYFYYDKSIIVIKHKNLIFILMEDDSTNTNELRKMHYKFEKYCETDYPTVEPCADDNEERFFIYGAKLGKFDLFYSGKASMVKSDERIEDLTDMGAINNCQFILTKLMLEGKKLYWWKTGAVLKWWSQAHFSNVNNIFVGFKDDQGVVNKPAILTTVADLIKFQYKRTRVCEGFLHTFLNLVLETMSDVDDPGTMYKYQFDTEGNIRYSVHNVDEELPIFSDDFLTYMKRH
ncbi:decapping and exoribonuclease protein-like [Anastrepha obliqua]|uniref:decapping and exoribonuclease protein-like n=1 Tax=Anastrepha obliqua TaxID=95512 RepID=UPI002409B21F|nr:decapping and exoribonuclease protein-like [Anastrepha obliqua]